jgi:hypothetical protein
LIGAKLTQKLYSLLGLVSPRSKWLQILQCSIVILCAWMRTERPRYNHDPFEKLKQGFWRSGKNNRHNV